MIKERTKRMIAMLMAILICLSTDVLPAMASQTETSVEMMQSADIEDADGEVVVETTMEEENEKGSEIIPSEEAFLIEAASHKEMEADNPNAIPADFVDDSDEVLQQLMEQAEDIVMASAVNGSKKADVVFVIDTTGSMSGYISSVKTNLATFVNYLAEKGITLRFGIVTYEDITCDGMNSTRVFEADLAGSTWYTTVSDTIAAISSIRLGYGGDIEETVVDALGYLVDDVTYNWSGNATRCAIVLTDVNYKYNNRWGYTNDAAQAMREVAEDLAERHIVTSVITNQYYYSYYQELVEITGGVLGDIVGNYLTTLMEMADNILKYAAQSKIGVYVLPGYMGSQLYMKDDENTEEVEDEKVWVGVETLMKDVLNFVGEVLDTGLSGIFPLLKHNEKIYSTKSILGRNEDGEGAKVEVDSEKDLYGSQDIYKSLIEELKNNLDEDVYSVKFFPYDWLGDLNDSVTTLENDIKSSGFDKVIFVTHSTGGLLAANYIAKSELNRDKIEKAILVAPPLYGTYTALEPLEKGETSSLATMLNDNLPEQLVGLREALYPKVDVYSVVYSWVRSAVKNTPTTYQLLPSLEYLKFMPQIYSEDFTSPVTNMEDYYAALKNSKGNLNENLLDGNENSHKYFRETVLGGDIRSVLNQVDTTLIGNRYGYDTPAIAIYSPSFFGKSTKYKEILYRDKGDGTVMGVSALLDKLPGTAEDGIRRIDMSEIDDSKNLDHNGMVTEQKGIETILACIKEDDSVDAVSLSTEDELYSEEAALDEGMSDRVKMIIYNNQETEFKVKDSTGNVVASATAEEITGFGETEGFIYDLVEVGTVSDSDISEYIYQIYVPNAGYTVELYNTTENAPNLQVSVATLDRDGYRKNTATYSAVEAVDGLIASFNLTEEVNDENVSALETEGVDYVGTMSSYNDWSIDESVLISKIGKTVTLELFGSDADKIDVKKDIEWISSDTNVVTVEGNVVTAVGYGTATIYASNKDGNGKVETCEVKVGKYPESISIDDFILVKNHRIQPDVTFAPADTNMTDMVYVSDDEQIVKVLKENTLVAVGEGTARIIGTTENGLTAEFYVTVTTSDTLYVDEVSIDPLVAVLSEDKKTEVVARIVPETALNKMVTWGVVDETIASVSVNDDNSCTLTGLKEGVTKLTVLSDDGSYSDESTIVVGSVLDITKNNRMIMKLEESKQTVLGKDGVYYPIVAASSTNEEVVMVTETGMITAVAPGCAVLAFEGNLKGKKVSGSVQIEVTNTLDDVVEEVSIETKSVKSNVYKKVSGSVTVDVKIEDAALGLFSLAEEKEDVHSVAMAVTNARFVDKTVDSMFKLSPVSDNVLNIYPNVSLEPEAVLELAKEYASKIIVTIAGKEYTTTNPVTIQIDTKVPVIKTKAVTLNTYFTDARAKIPFTTDCGEVTEVKINDAEENALPQGIQLIPKTQEVKYSGGTIKAGNTVKLLAKTEGIRDFVEVKLNVKAKKAKPKFKLSKGSINVFKDIEFAKGQELTLKTLDKKTLSDYQVANLVLADESTFTEKEQKTYKINSEYKISDFNVDDGTFKIKAISSDGVAKAGKLLLQVKLYGTTETIRIPLNVKVISNPKLNLKTKSLKLNSQYNNGVTKTVKFTISPADYDTKDLRVVVTTKKGVETEDLKARLQGNSVVITTTSAATSNKVYYVKFMDGIINTKLKVTMKYQRPSAKITCSGAIDIADESKSAKVKVTLKGIEADASNITISPTVTYRYRNGWYYYTKYVSDAFKAESLGNGTFKITLNKDSSSYRSGYISTSNKYKISAYVYVNGNGVGYASEKNLSVKMNKQKMELNYSQIDLTETNKNLPVALVGTLSKMPSENAQWEVSGKALDFCDVRDMGNGKYSITMNPVMTKRDASGKLTMKAYMPGTKKVIAKKTIKVTYTK